MSDRLVASRRTGKLYPADKVPRSENPVDIMPVLDAEPYYEQKARNRGARDDKFDTTHLAPHKAWRLGRDYIAHALRYGHPMKVVRENWPPNGEPEKHGPRILEMGCGKELPFFRVLTVDHSAMQWYKPRVYVGADLNKRINYKPKVDGIDTTILEGCNVIEDDLTDHTFDMIISFEVIEHMDKPDGLRFLDRMFTMARRVVDREGGHCRIILSTPVNGEWIAKNHIYEWGRSELRRAFEQRGGKVLEEFGMFANTRDLVNAFDKVELEMWNRWAKFHSPHTLSVMFAHAHPEVARNICWHIEVS